MRKLRPQTMPWRGFRQEPHGRLLVQLVDLETRMGLAYERSVGFEKDPHTHERLMIVCPRGACRVEVKAAGERFALDSSRILMVPSGMEHANHGLSAVYDTMALFPDDTFVDQLIEENGLGATERKLLSKSCLTARRTRWLDDILNRYFFERVLNRKSPLGCTFFLEKQILNELARILFSEKFLAYAEPITDDANDLALKALSFIEGNLFEPISITDIARATRVSPSALLRAFKREFRQTPYAYIKNRRLDEAASLLTRGDYQVADVSVLVGYEDFSAFSRAFKRQFGKSPTAFVPH